MRVLTATNLLVLLFLLCMLTLQSLFLSAIVAAVDTAQDFIEVDDLGDGVGGPPRDVAIDYLGPQALEPTPSTPIKPNTEPKMPSTPSGTDGIRSRCVKGDRGPPGPRGPPGQPGVCSSACQRGVKGDRGQPGPPGRSVDPAMLAATVDRRLRRKLNEMGTAVVKGEPGEPGLCVGGGGDGRIGAHVVQNTADLNQISQGMQLGSLVFVQSTSTMYFKADFLKNQWLVIDYRTKPSVRFPMPQSRTTIQQPFSSHVTQPPTTESTARPLRLLLLPTQLSGDFSFRTATGPFSADYACGVSADSASFANSGFRAFVTDQLNSPVEEVVPEPYRSTAPIVNLLGERVFSNYNEMVRRGVWNPKIQLQDFHGRNMTEIARSDGDSKELLAWQPSRKSDHPIPENCFNHYVAGRGFEGLTSNLLEGRLFESKTSECSRKRAILCIETPSSSYRRRRRR